MAERAVAAGERDAGASTAGHGLTVLVVEDDHAMSELIRTYLEHAGYRVAVAETGEEGIELAQSAMPHLILLDLMLPLRSGWETCRALRARADVPIIMVTARRAEEDRLRGFAVGADDYVIKPFSPRELVARVGAVLRRHHATAVQPLTVGPLTVDPRRREARLDGRPVSLREREFDLLAYLAGHAGEVCSRADLLDHVWGYDFEGDERTIDTHVRRLRDALGPAAALVHTVWGIGYKLSVDGA
jgi:DNA-binding response OmpR family regulator